MNKIMYILDIHWFCNSCGIALLFEPDSEPKEMFSVERIMLGENHVVETFNDIRDAVECFDRTKKEMSTGDEL